MRDVDDLLGFLGAAPSPYHAVAEAARRLVLAGFVELNLTERWPGEPGQYFVQRDGALVAWSVAAWSRSDAATPFTIVGAHTDSPNLRIKPRPDTGGHGWRQLAVEVYGGALWNSWLDRDLGLSGRVMVEGCPEPLLLRIDEPLMRIPQLAIHLDRDVNGQGLKLNPQCHLSPVWGLGAGVDGDFVSYLAQALTEQGDDPIGADEIVSWDLMLHDLTPPALIGRDQELIASARLDNLLSCWAAVAALCLEVERSRHRDDAAMTGGPNDVAPVAMACLYDHEEVGSASATGAAGSFLAQVIERSVLARGGTREDLLRALAGSMCVSADGAHATHPNYPECHEPGHHVVPNGGPVIKVNANQRYASDARTAATLVEACASAGIDNQWFVSRNDQPCGSTIGPATAAQLGVATVDVGLAMLSMHSARELCGAEDPADFVAMLAAFLSTVPRPGVDSQDGNWFNVAPDRPRADRPGAG